jgi:hypothetical protein
VIVDKLCALAWNATVPVVDGVKEKDEQPFTGVTVAVVNPVPTVCVKVTGLEKLVLIVLLAP